MADDKTTQIPTMIDNAIASLSQRIGHVDRFSMRVAQTNAIGSRKLTNGWPRRAQSRRHLRADRTKAHMGAKLVSGKREPLVAAIESHGLPHQATTDPNYRFDPLLQAAGFYIVTRAGQKGSKTAKKKRNLRSAV